MLTIKIVGALLLILVVGTLLGVTVAIMWHRRHAPPDDAASPDEEEAPKQEVRRYFLLNETGNVLIATSLSPSVQLPDSTLAMFSEAMAHLSAVFFAIAGTEDPDTGKSFSLYNYDVLKRALALHPVFIRVSSENPPKVRSVNTLQSSAGPHVEMKNATESVEQESTSWLDEQMKRSRDALGMDDSPENANKLRSIHSQMRAEAERLKTRKKEQENKPMLLTAARSENDEQELVEAEVGHITLYCECLMGVSLVSLKLAHAHYEDYLSAEPVDMQEDIYLFVSPSQLTKTLKDLSNLPHISSL